MAARSNHPETSPEGLEAKAVAEKADAKVAKQVQKQVDQETEQGYRGVETDPTPNENYTVAGVTSGAPTPETDDEHAEKVRQHLRGVETKAAGVAGR